MNTPTDFAPQPTGPLVTPASRQTRSFLKILMGLLIVVVFLGGGLFWLDLRKAREEEEKSNARQHVILRPGNEAGDWRVKEGSRVEELNRNIENLKRELGQLRDQLGTSERKAQSGESTGSPRGRERSDGSRATPPPPLDQILPPPQGAPRTSVTGGAPAPGALTPAHPAPGPTPPAPGSRTPTSAMPATPPAEDDAGSSGAETPNAQHLLAKRPPEGPRGGPSSSLPPDSGKLRVITPHGINPRNAIPEAEKVGWLPSGTIIPGILLTGIDASTLAGQNLPYPVLIRLSDTALLPNDFRMDLQNCVAVGAAVGDLATERVSIRTESLSCLLKRSGALVTIDGDLKATILGGDGKTGIRGRVVMKEGALIARTMVAGFLSGLSEAFKPRISYAPIQLGSSDVTNNSAFSLPPIQDTLAAAGLAGIGKSMDRLTEFYTALAMKTAPVIEVSSGTTVDLVVLKGLPLRWKASAPSEQRSDIIE
jgi:hypothetical protein